MATQLTARKDVYQIVTDKIIKIMEQGFIPWKRPWSYQSAACNYITKKPYRGINAILLNFNQVTHPYYLTFKQAVDLGGKIKKGSKSHIVTYWNWTFTHAETGHKLTLQQARVLPAKLVKKVGFLRYYNVFNISDIENIDFKLPEILEKELPEKISHCEQIIDEMPNRPKLSFGGNQAYYIPAADLVNMPEMKNFDNAELYYSTFFHELAHSTGHANRLNREGITVENKFGSDSYSKEELVAELSASFLCAITGIHPQTIEDSAAYIQSWVKRFKEDKKMIIEAAGKAQKAADYIINLSDNLSDELEVEQSEAA